MSPASINVNDVKHYDGLMRDIYRPDSTFETAKIIIPQNIHTNLKWVFEVSQGKETGNESRL